MLTQIKNWWTGVVIFECECDLDSESLRLGFAVKAYIEKCRADLTRADLTDANLTGADLTGADLTDANLIRADLTGADLTDANLTDANLTRANLTGADLTGADLTDANLTDANLTIVRDDIWAVLSSAPREVPALRQALSDGKVDGSTYSGECACLVGTLAHARGGDEYCIPNLVPNSSRAAERFFLGIRKGDKPETNQASKLALEWVDMWLANVRQLVNQ
jgi:hypothetical protein